MPSVVTHAKMRRYGLLASITKQLLAHISAAISVAQAGACSAQASFSVLTRLTWPADMFSGGKREGIRGGAEDVHRSRAAEGRQKQLDADG